MVRIFASDLSECRKKKLFFGILLSISAFIIFVVFPILWIFKTPIRKTTRDFVYEYIMNRENYNWSDFNRALYGAYQFKYPLYDTINKPIVDIVKNNYQIQEFGVKSMKYDPKNKEWLVYGTLTRCISNINDIMNNKYTCTTKNKTFRVKEIRGYFIVLNSKNG